MDKALLKFSILVDNDGEGHDIRADILLYREDGELIWRIGGPLGDEVETLPRPATVKQAKADAALCYPENSTWRPRASWM